MSHENHHDEKTQTLEFSIENSFEDVADSLLILFHSAMKVERAKHLEVHPYEREKLVEAVQMNITPKDLNPEPGLLI